MCSDYNTRNGFVRRSKSGSYVSTYLAGKCSNQEWEIALARWLEIEEADRAQKRQADFFLKSDAAIDVMRALDKAWQRKICVAVTGDPGIGKTRTIQWFTLDKPDVFLIQAGPTCADAFALQAALIDQIGEDNPELDTAINRADQLARFFIKFPRMIIVEDFDLLRKSAFEFLLRYLWNRASIPLFLAGNKQGIDKLKNLPAQLRSRIRHEPIATVDSPFSKSVVSEFLEHHMDGVEITGGMVKLAHGIANLEGSAHMRTVLDLCDDVRDEMRDGEADPEIAMWDNWKRHIDYSTAKHSRISALIEPPVSIRKELVPA